MKTAVIYARYSCDNQTEQSIEGQIRVCEDFAKNNDIIIVNKYIDRAMTGTNDLRPEFQNMLNDCKSHEWSYVLVYKLDRFSRNKYESVMHKKTLKEHGVKVLSAMENIPDTPEGIILESLLEGMNQYYSAELAQKVKRGMRETRLKGYFQGGALPYGYKLDGRKIVIDEQRAEVVNYIFKQYSLDVPVRKIIETLTSKGILHREKPFATNTVYFLLRNEKYLGVYKYKDEIIDNMYPQIISQELFNKVKEKIDSNKYGKKSIRLVYLLRNKLKCGNCGMPVSAECGTSRAGQKIDYYKCVGRKKNKNSCKKATIRKDLLEDLILTEIKKQLMKKSNLDIMIKHLMNIQQNKESNTMLSMLEKEKKHAQTMLDNIVRAIEQGIMNGTTNKRMIELEKKLETIEREILIEKSKTDIEISENDLRNFFETAIMQEPKLLVSYLIKEVILYDDKIVIEFNSPIKQSPDNQGFLFCRIFRDVIFYDKKRTIQTSKEFQIDMYI